MKESHKLVLSIFLTAIVSGLIFYFSAQAFNGPTQSPPSGSGALAVGANDAVDVGTSTASTNTELVVVGSTTNNTAYGLKVEDSSGNVLFSVRNDGVASGTTISGGSFAGTISAGNISAGQFGLNTGGGNYSFPANLAATSGTVSLASTTITGQATTTNLSITGITNALLAAGSGGAISAYTGSSCASGAVQAISATGTATCTNSFFIGGTLNVTSTATFQGAVTINAGLTQASGSVSLATTTVGNFAETGTDATTTANIGGTALKLGQCSTATVSVPGAPVTAAVAVSPQANPGAGVLWEGYVSAAGTVTVDICVATNTTPTAEKYNVRIIR